MLALSQVRYNYEARYSDELDLTEGSTIVLVKRVDGDWFEVRRETWQFVRIYVDHHVW